MREGRRGDPRYASGRSGVMGSLHLAAGKAPEASGGNGGLWRGRRHSVTSLRTRPLAHARARLATIRPWSSSSRFWSCRSPSRSWPGRGSPWASAASAKRSRQRKRSRPLARCRSPSSSRRTTKPRASARCWMRWRRRRTGPSRSSSWTTARRTAPPRSYARGRRLFRSRSGSFASRPATLRSRPTTSATCGDQKKPSRYRQRRTHSRTASMRPHMNASRLPMPTARPRRSGSPRSRATRRPRQRPSSSATGRWRERGWLGRFVRYETALTATLSIGAIGHGRAWHAVGRNLSYPRSLWRRLGGFAPHADSLGGDDDLFVQDAARAGAEIRYVLDPEAFVPSAAPETWRGFWRQRRRHASAGAHYARGVLLALGALQVSGLALWVGAPLLHLAFGVPWGWGLLAVRLLLQRAVLSNAWDALGARSRPPPLAPRPRRDARRVPRRRCRSRALPTPKRW